MTRAHRAAHRLLWPILAIVIVVGFSMALYLKPTPERPVAGETRP
jgi:hypothetical protein